MTLAWKELEPSCHAEMAKGRPLFMFPFAPRRVLVSDTPAGRFYLLENAKGSVCLVGPSGGLKNEQGAWVLWASATKAKAYVERETKGRPA